MGMASTVDIRDMRKQLTNWKGICIGLFCQFFLLPFFGYLMILIFSLPIPVGIPLLIVVSSPGGSYSNWWCSIMNADLGLSVSMTTVSTFLGCGFLPLNVFVYSYAAYRSDVLYAINFGNIFISPAIVIVAISVGIFCSYKIDTPRWHKTSNILGNVSGLALIIFTVILAFIDDGSKTEMETANYENDIGDYFVVGIPCLMGLIVATLIASITKRPKPERLAIAVECCYQNTGITTSAVLSIFSGQDLQRALRVPFVYGLVQAVCIAIYLIIFWKLGWTKAPKDERLCCTVITTSYEVHGEDGGNEGEKEEAATLGESLLKDNEGEWQWDEEEPRVKAQEGGDEEQAATKAK